MVEQFQDPRKKFITSPEQVTWGRASTASFYTSPIEGFTASVQLAIGGQSNLQKIFDWNTLKKLSEDDSPYISADEANKRYPVPEPYYQDVKESVAKFNHDVTNRSQMENQIISDINQNALGSTFLPFAGGLVGGFLDPVNLIAGSTLSLGARGIGIALMKMGGRRIGGVGSFLAGGTIQNGRFVEGNIGQQLTAEIFDQGIGNIATEALYTGVDYKTQQGVTAEDYVANIGLGTFIGTGIGMGLRGLNKLRADTPETTNIAAETAANQADAGLLPNTDPIYQAHDDGLTSGMAPSEGALLPSQKPNLPAEPRPSNIELVKGKDFRLKTLYLPLADTKGVDSSQLFVNRALIGFDTLQLTDNPHVARNAARHPLVIKDSANLEAVKIFDLKPLDLDSTVDTLPDLKETIKSIFGKKEAENIYKDNITFKELLLRAQELSATKTKTLQDNLLDVTRSNALVYTENQGSGKSYDVIELVKGKTYTTKQVDINKSKLNAELSNDHLLKAQKSLITYARDPKNQLTYSPDKVTYDGIAQIPIAEKPRDRMRKLDESIKDLDEELNTLREIDEVDIPPVIKDTEKAIPPVIKDTETAIPPVIQEGAIPPKIPETAIPPVIQEGETAIPPVIQEPAVPPKIPEPTIPPKNRMEAQQAEADAWMEKNGHLLDDIDDDFDYYPEDSSYGEYDSVIQETFYDSDAMFGISDIEGNRVETAGVKDFADISKAEDSEKLRKAIKELDICSKRKK